MLATRRVETMLIILTDHKNLVHLLNQNILSGRQEPERWMKEIQCTRKSEELPAHQEKPKMFILHQSLVRSATTWRSVILWLYEDEEYLTPRTSSVRHYYARGSNNHSDEIDNRRPNKTLRRRKKRSLWYECSEMQNIAFHLRSPTRTCNTARRKGIGVRQKGVCS